MGANRERPLVDNSSVTRAFLGRVACGRGARDSRRALRDKRTASAWAATPHGRRARGAFDGPDRSAQGSALAGAFGTPRDDEPASAITP